MLKSLPYLLLAVFATIGPTSRGPAAAAPDPITFEHHIRPIFKTYCLDCHSGGENTKGKLDLRLRRFAVQGGRKGAAVVPGDLANSLLLDRLKSGEMPPGEKKVPAEQIALVERWIKAGAPTLKVEPSQLPPGIGITAEERSYWFFQPVRRVEPLVFGPADGVRTPVDAFVLAKLRDRGLSFNPDADRRTLLRRAFLDVIGLPPAQAEIEAFLADDSAEAWEKQVDRLLASPHYGERWGRHWLDIVGYADSEGDGTADTPRPHAWKYRDYVIRSFNADKPYDRFLVEQLAGDELVPRPWKNLKPEQIELLIATGFLGAAPDASTSGGEAEAQQHLTDTLRIVSSSLMGLTVACAQCHDHRYDPIPQTDYYRLRAIFEPAIDPVRVIRPAQRLVSLYTDEQQAKAAAVLAESGKMQADLDSRQKIAVRAAFEKELDKFPADIRERLRIAFDTPADKRDAEQKRLVADNPKLNVTPGVLYQYNQAAADELKKLRDQIAAKRAEKPVEDFVSVISETPGHVPITRIFHRGDYRQPKDEVAPGDLDATSPQGQHWQAAAKEAGQETTGRRLAFARHLTDGRHPATARVLVNRVWLHHFGKGLVDTPGDFGVLGLRPTHPELLDWLADEFVRQGWSLKKLHRLLLTSTVYRQSSLRKAKEGDADALYGRYPVRRLDAETFRDRILATTGRLDRRLGGPPVALMEDAVGQVVAPDDRPRRGIYLQARRTKPFAFLTTFDFPAGEMNCDRRISSTAAPQSLLLMNGEFALQQAAHFARRLLSERSAPGAMAEQRIDLAWQLAYQRSPDAQELASALAFLARQEDDLRGALGAGSQLGALTNLCQQLLSSNEFLYVD